MKFAYSTNAFKRYSLEEAIRLIKGIGFDGVEIMADRPHLYPPDYQPAQPASPSGRQSGGSPTRLEPLKKLLQEQNLVVSNLNTFTLFAIGDLPDGEAGMHHPSWIEKEASVRRIRIEHTQNCLRLATELGCPNISIQPGGRVEYFSPTESLNLFISGLEQVIPEAKRLNIKILVEPEPDLLIENSSQFTEFIKRVDTSIIGLNCDIGHFWCAGEDPAEVIRKFGKYIHHLHIEDIKDRIHNHKICGHGDINFASIFDALRDVGYDGFISLELYPYQDNPVEAGRESLKFLQQFV